MYTNLCVVAIFQDSYTSALDEGIPYTTMQMDQTSSCVNNSTLVLS